MKAIVFDSGPIITFALNSLLPMMKFLQEEYKGIFYIPNDVEKEIIAQPSKSKKFGFESYMVRGLLKDNIVEVFDTKIYRQETEIITTLANGIYSINGRDLYILNAGELDALVLAKNINADAVVVDERTTRVILENPYRLVKYLEKKFHGKVEINKDKLKEFEKHFSTLKIIRSVELALVAFDKGYFDTMAAYENKIDFVSSLLWALKLHGSAVSEREIAALIKYYKQGK